NPSLPVAGGGLYMTTDRGLTWHTILTADSESVAINPNNPEQMYVCSTNTGLWLTENLHAINGSGQPSPTFTQVASYPHLRPARAFFTPYVIDEVWIAGNGAGLMVGTANQPA